MGAKFYSNFFRTGQANVEYGELLILLGGEDEDLEDLEDDELSSSIMDAFQYKVTKILLY